MTLLVRDERDIVEQHLAFHFAAGVDVVIVTDHASTDGTEESSRGTSARGRVRVLREPDGPFRQREWVTRMARLAATEHGADWVINGDADEFWWPRGGSLQEVLAAVPRRYGIVQSFVRHFVPVRRRRAAVPRADDAPAQPDRRRSTTRAARGGRSGRSSTARHPEVDARRGRPRRRRHELRPLRGWYPIECLHFPLRTPAQVERKGRAWGERRREVLRVARTVVAGPGAGVSRARSTEAAASGAGRARTTPSLAIAPGRRRERSRPGSSSRTPALRDALRSRSTRASRRSFRVRRPLDDAAFAVDAAVLGEADVVRTQRWLDDLERRRRSRRARPAARPSRACALAVASLAAGR